MGISRGRSGMGRAGPLLDVVSGWGIVTLAGAVAAVDAGTVPDLIKSWLGDQRPFLTVLCAPVTIAFALGRPPGHEVTAIPHPYQTSDDKAGAPCISS